MFRFKKIVLVQDMCRSHLRYQKQQIYTENNRFINSNLKTSQTLLAKHKEKLTENYIKLNRKSRRKLTNARFQNFSQIAHKQMLTELVLNTMLYNRNLERAQQERRHEVLLKQPIYSFDCKQDTSFNLARSAITSKHKQMLTELVLKTTLHNRSVESALQERRRAVLLQQPVYCRDYKQDAFFNSAKPIHLTTSLTYTTFYGNPLGAKLKSGLLGQAVRAYCTASSKGIKKLISETNEIENVKSLYPKSKNVLHSFFYILSQELKQNDLVVTPQYKFVKNKRDSIWMCTYNLKWPEQIKFTQNGNTKQEASHKAALSALAWLKSNNKIANDGKPIIYNKEAISNITKHAYSVLVLDNFVETKLNDIRDIFENNLIQLLPKEEVKSVTKENLNLENEWPQADGRFKQKFNGVDFYTAFEPSVLPISEHKESIIKSVQNHRVVIIRGEPGCGKSTRVPQYILEAWAKSSDAAEQPCRIVITQPRRIAAISLAERVASEREERVGNTVGYQVRLKSNFNNGTGRILYCTTGILLRRIQSDPKLSDCTHVILDEAHERDVNTDLLMNLLRKAVDLNPNLKVLIMSATIDTTIFQDYFEDSATLHIPGFTYPVQEHFLEDNNNTKLMKTYQMCSSPYPTIIHEDVAKMIESIHRNKPEGAILCFLSGWDDILKVKNLLSSKSNMEVLCLHSRLQVWEQQKIFDRPPHGYRKVILSTNIAETSVTIDDVVYVIDTGIHKEERFDAKKGVICIDNHWISKASATQRKGRAGRCRPGECYHLYSKSKYFEMESYSIPEILRTSLTKIVLDSKVYSNNINAIDFLEELVCPPDSNAITKAVLELKDLEMLDEEENLTPLGKTVSEFQMAPKLAKAMINAVIFKCVTPIVDIATLFSSETAIFSKDLVDKEGPKKTKLRYFKDSDHLALMVLFEEWLNCIENHDYNGAEEFCMETGIVNHKMQTLQKLRNIHFDYLTKGLKSVLPVISDDFSDNSELVKGVLLSGVGTFLQYRNWDIAKGRMKKTNVFITRRNQKATITSESVNSKKINFSSSFLMHINETISNLRHTTLVRETSVISPLAVLLFKNGTLEIEELSKEQNSLKIPSDNQVLLSFKNSDVTFLCDKEQAEAIVKCREAIRTCMQHYVYQLTTGGSYNMDVNQNWQQILVNLNNAINLNTRESYR